MLQSSSYQEKQGILYGPWGGHGGFHWDDGKHSAIRQIEISHGQGIDSIRIEYDNNGRSVLCERHGGTGGSTFNKMRLEYPDEYLISVHGYYGSLHESGPSIVRSLTFDSNKRTYGPFGVQKGTYFTIPKTDGKIVGFLGKSGWYLDTIGMYFEPSQKHVYSNNHDLNDKSHQFVDPFQKPINNSTYKSHQYVAQEKDTYGYSMIHGSLGPNYDLIVAVRQKDHDHKPGSTPHHVENKNLHNVEHKNPHNVEYKNLHHQEHKNQIATTIPNKIEKVPSKNLVTPHVVPKKEIAATIIPNKIEKVSSKNSVTPHVLKNDQATPHIPEKHPGKHDTELVTCGPWGGTGGSLFDDGIYDGIRQIKVSRNVGITSIKVCYDQDGQSIWGSKNGGSGSFKSGMIIFDYPSEILTHITGYYGPTMIMGPNAIKSLTFHTTKGKHGPYGEEQGVFFSTMLKEGSMVVGFHGRKGLFLDAIGVHVLQGKVSSSSSLLVPPVSNAPEKQSMAHKVDHSQTQTQWTFKVVGQQKVVKDPSPCGPGPWGGDGGKPWDDGVYTGIKQIILTITDAICSIEIEYDRNGQSIWSVKHGGTSGQSANRVKLEYPHEVLTCISGYYGPIKKDSPTKVIHSLTFHTSRTKYGPFGEERGSYFSSGMTQGKLVGFHGRSSSYLDAIGVHMQHWLGNQKYKSSVMKMFSN